MFLVQWENLFKLMTSKHTIWIDFFSSYSLETLLENSILNFKQLKFQWKLISTKTKMTWVSNDDQIIDFKNYFQNNNQIYSKGTESYVHNMSCKSIDHIIWVFLWDQLSSIER